MTTMTNFHYGKEHVFTNRSENDTIVLRAGIGEKLVVEGVSGGGEGLPITVTEDVPALMFTDVLEVPKANATIQNNYFGLDCSFNKYHSDYDVNTTNKHHKFIVATANRLATGGPQNGGFTVFNEDLEETHSMPGSRYTTLGQCEYPLFRRGKIHGSETSDTIVAGSFGITVEDPNDPNINRSLNAMFDVFENNVFENTYETVTSFNIFTSTPYDTNMTLGVSVSQNYYIQWGKFSGLTAFPAGHARVYFKSGSNHPWQETTYTQLDYRFDDVDLSENPDLPTTGIFCGIDGGGTFRMFDLLADGSISQITYIDWFSSGSPYYPTSVACCYGYYFVGCGGSFVNVYSASPSTGFAPGELTHFIVVPGTIYSCGIFKNRLVVLTQNGIYLYDLLENDFKLLDSIEFGPGALFESFPLYGVWNNSWRPDCYYAKMIDIFFDEVLVCNPMLQKCYLLKIGPGTKSVTHQIKVDSNNLELSSPFIHFNTIDGVFCNDTLYCSKPVSSYDAMEFKTINSVNQPILAGSISVNGSSVNYGTSSDYRLKDTINDLKDGLNKVLKLEPKYYKLKQVGEDRLNAGFIAHELQDVIPQAVSGTKDQVDEKGKNVYQSVDNSLIVPYLVASIQELFQEIEDLS